MPAAAAAECAAWGCGPAPPPAYWGLTLTLRAAKRSAVPAVGGGWCPRARTIGERLLVAPLKWRCRCGAGPDAVLCPSRRGGLLPPAAPASRRCLPGWAPTSLKGTASTTPIGSPRRWVAEPYLGAARKHRGLKTRHAA
ncbi:hypothetical protein NDU88_005989 [Pleurodeles waltl]|uniref:Uncharacterized protein n=1 Tax=Pleurodeles waltl TaxID=8319 RepID=A0AAV7X2V8_PLEWA|nr:hypothetical protein NDU88_005989 [Pleurodeles waltl]